MARITSGEGMLCLQERIQREENTVLAFFLKNLNNPSLGKSGASAVLRKRLDRLMIDDTRCKKLAEEAEKRAEARKQVAVEQEKAETDKPNQVLMSKEELAVALDMRPASPKTRRLLYNGTSHEGKGRALYLEHRYRKDPEVKFPYPLPMSWDYGWHLSDSIKTDSIKKSPHGHVSIVNNTFFTRTGITFGHNDDDSPKTWYG